GHREVELDPRRVVERRDDAAGAHVAADADLPEAGPPVERGADDRVGETRFGRRGAGEVAVQRRFGLLELRGGDDLARPQLPAPLELAARVGERGARLRELRLRLVVVELDEDFAARDLGA